MSYVINSARDVGRAVRPGQLVVLESTTYPGTTRQDMLPVILREAAARDVNLTPGTDLVVAFSPEREDPGRTSHTTRTTPKLVGGLDDASTDLAVALYKRAVQAPVRVSSAEVAEAAKVLENIFRAVNIAMVNELKVVYAAMGIDIWDVIDAAKTKPFGFMPFYPGPGLGGHCIPIDPFYLTWKAREYGQETRFIELAGEVNTAMPEYVIQRTGEALAENRQTIRGSRILMIGIAYKANVDDDRESPAYVLWELLEKQGATVEYHDPHVPVIRPSREHAHFAGRKSVALTAEAVSGYDLVLVATQHKAVDWALIAQHAQRVVDSRNALSAAMKGRSNYFKA
jgi:UDP-N-acetyl-D-glucosamine dehydrogenase